MENRTKIVKAGNSHSSSPIPTSQNSTTQEGTQGVKSSRRVTFATPPMTPQSSHGDSDHTPTIARRNSDRRPKVKPTDPIADEAGEVLLKLASEEPSNLNSRTWTKQADATTKENLKLLQDLRKSPASNPDPRGRKRKLPETGTRDLPGDNISGSEDEEDENSLAKRARLDDTNQKYVQPRRPLEDSRLQPIRIEYPLHPITDRSDQWFTNQFRHLYNLINEFAKTFFGVHDLSLGAFFEPWGIDLGKEFLFWVEQVAEDDEVKDGGWDNVLRDTMYRRYLIMGIVMKVIKVHVFDEDLFGATKEEKALMLSIERSFLDREGFQRTNLRSAAVRTILSHSPVTKSFHPFVANLTGQIALLLNPVSLYLTSIPPVEARPLPHIQDQYQALHNIVSTAAYLSLCIRLSPTIFHFVDVTLGDAYDNDDHWNLDAKGYWDSKALVEKQWRRSHRTWQKASQEAECAYKGFVADNKEDTPDGRSALEAHRRIHAERPRQTGVTHKAMSKMSVWPVITRYKPGGEADDAKESKGERMELKEKDGFRIVQISKAAVVLYYGKKERAGKTSLLDFLERKRRELARGEQNTWRVGLRAAAVTAILGIGLILGEQTGFTTLGNVVGRFSTIG